MVELPETVLKILGSEAARDFADWLERWLHQVHLNVVTPISALVARQKVNVLMLERVSNLLLADEPVLTELSEGQSVWRVPVDLTFPQRGRVGRVGELDVEARYGEVRYSDDMLTEIGAAATDLAKQTLHPMA